MRAQTRLGRGLLAAFAAESFGRLGFELAQELRGPRGRAQRASGFDAMLADVISAFDKKHTRDRDAALFEAAKVPKSHKAVEPLEALITFRNEIAHDSPGLHTSDGSFLVARDGEGGLASHCLSISEGVE
jgi:hypothetical protein